MSAIHGILVLLLSVASGFAGVVAGPFMNPANASVYYLLSQNTWSNAQAEAASLGGHLVTIQNEQEQNWVFSTFNPFVSGLGIWIGLQRVGSTEVFQWITGEPLAYTAWSEGEPNNNLGQENCVEILPPNAGKWNDISGSNSRFSVAEVEPPTTLSIRELVELSWMSRPDRQYQVQWAPQAETNAWQNLGSPYQGTGFRITVYDPVAGGRKFYRIRAVP